MAPLRLLVAGLFVAAALAGCASSQKSNLSSVYPDLHNAPIPSDLAALAGSGNVSLIGGSHVEARLNEGAWSDNATVAGATVTLASPTMTSPAPSGGGGETTPLAVSQNGTSHVDLRIKEYAELSGYTAWWLFVAGNATDAPVALAADQSFEHALPAAGPFVVFVYLSKSAGDKTPVAIYAEPLVGHVSAHWVITGEVEPVDATGVVGLPAPTATPRDQMVDKYTVDLPAGATVKAATAFAGSWSPGQGTDVDLGLYNPDGVGLACAAGTGAQGLGVSAPNDTTQATEAFTAATESAGLWSVQVGAMQNGCPVNGGAGGTFAYTNGGPVPYTLDLVVS